VGQSTITTMYTAIYTALTGVTMDQLKIPSGEYYILVV